MAGALLIIGIISFLRAVLAAATSDEHESNVAIFIANFIVNMMGLTLFCGFLYVVAVTIALAIQHVMG